MAGEAYEWSSKDKSAYLSYVEPKWTNDDDSTFYEYASPTADWLNEDRQVFDGRKLSLSGIIGGKSPTEVFPSREFVKLLNANNFDLLDRRQQTRNLYALKIGQLSGRSLEECLDTAEKFTVVEGRLRNQIKKRHLLGPIATFFIIDGVGLWLNVDTRDYSGCLSFGG